MTYAEWRKGVGREKNGERERERQKIHDDPAKSKGERST